jgi:hypothetical protein
MSGVSPPFDWSRRPEKAWFSPMGLWEIQDRLRPSIDFEPDEYQLNCTAKILMGCDVFCISATGDGKSSLIYMPALIREGTMTLVVSPTNFLESDMVSLSHKVTITNIKLWKGCRPGEERSIRSCHQLCNFGSCQVGCTSTRSLARGPGWPASHHSHWP